jgi:suppressor of tumorigenicity protein 13
VFFLFQAAYDKAKRKEQSSSRSPGGAPPRGFPGGMPGGGFPGGMPGGFPGGAMPGGSPGAAMPGGFPGSAMPGGVPGNVDMSKILNVSAWASYIPRFCLLIRFL